MPVVMCSYCGGRIDCNNRRYNRSLKHGYNLFCNRKCSACHKRTGESEEAKQKRIAHQASRRLEFSLNTRQRQRRIMYEQFAEASMVLSMLFKEIWKLYPDTKERRNMRNARNVRRVKENLTADKPAYYRQYYQRRKAAGYYRLKGKWLSL